jgi:hypothetical protein
MILMIDCEGSGCPGHGDGLMQLCVMCGQTVDTQHAEGYGLVTVHHQRPDILAMLARGDYG